MTKIFISYRRQDSEGYVGRMYDRLSLVFNEDDIFMDVQSIAPGADFVQVLEDAVAGCAVFLAVIGNQWATITDERGERRLDQWNDFVRVELASALSQNKVVIPILVGGSRMPAPDTLPDDLKAFARRNAIELSHKRFTHDVEQLIEAIKAHAPINESFKPAPIRDDAARNSKDKQLKAIRDDLIRATDSPLYPYRQEQGYFPVIGSGDANANILFLGEAPGHHESLSGQPFVGPSGDVLDELLDGIGLKRENVYMTNILLDRTPDNRDPQRDELDFYQPYVDRIIDVIRPSVLVTLGRFAMQYVLKKYDTPEKRGKISQLHGQLIAAQATYGDIHIVPMYHPAVVLYSPRKKTDLAADFNRLRIFI